MAKRRIAVITGTRAEYGLLYLTLRALLERGIDLQLIVTGAHLSADHGMTVRAIEADGIPIAARVDMALHSDKPVDIARSTGLALAGIAAELARLKPDIVLLLGDRYEMLGAAMAAALLQLPIAHIHGGEVTEGALDESLRHAITKLSYWHFATSEAYAKRIIQLGEDPQRVFTVGAPGIDNLLHLPLLSRAALEKELGIALTRPVILFTYHPETLSHVSTEAQIAPVLRALESFPGATLLMTGANADAGGRIINCALQELAQRRPQSLFRLSFGSLLYLSAMREADVVVGNSSSGMIEAPALGRATVNIGHRQAGRLRTPGVIDCACEEPSIVAAIRTALAPEFQQKVTASTVFGVPGSVSTRMVQLLETLELPSVPYKKFFDL
jgi:UDP-hydrolysing UDP-N-acetyl-D-glucosamine 2-epimerase